ncbi:hypothetical protein BTM25_57680 [Actinomadura rubteroloni]|uniref:Uncharacterized protein n=1 Tax=Actinomadura rubteroloni TaxID=1926885 RepID=A0A2P4UBD6_9ACTN|nr:hypothetical protein [Actinomadura rubteroloni]POM22356.1 hypothetical protein BTM25_57680 [Actinomadura rubteroloni]
MRLRARSASSLAATALGAALTLTACGGSGHGTSGASTAPTPTLAPVPSVKAADVRVLVGRWVGERKDYFEFKADGSGVWKQAGQTLWTGQAIPDGKNKYRFSWQGRDPQSGSYWGATIDAKGRLVFAGTNQTYSKAKRR